MTVTNEVDTMSKYVDDSVLITLKEKFEGLTDEELRQLYNKAVDIAVFVEQNPKFEQVFETYGADYELWKQDISDELKRRGVE